MDTGNSAVVARRYDLNINMVARWVREFKNGKHVNSSEASPSFGDLSKENQQLFQENDRLKKYLEKRT